MTQSDPLDDMELDRLLGAHQVPSLPPDFAQLLVGEAVREARPSTLTPLPAVRRRAHRPWTRRGLVAGIIAVNLIVASAIAATLGGHFPVLRHIAFTAARVLNLPQRQPAPQHTIRVTHRAIVRPAAPAVAPPVPPATVTEKAEIFADRHPFMALRQDSLATQEAIGGPRVVPFAERHPFAALALARRAARLRLDDRQAFERERRELEQRANARWPAQPPEVHDKP